MAHGIETACGIRYNHRRRMYPTDPDVLVKSIANLERRVADLEGLDPVIIDLEKSLSDLENKIIGVGALELRVRLLEEIITREREEEAQVATGPEVIKVVSPAGGPINRGEWTFRHSEDGISLVLPSGEIIDAISKYTAEKATRGYYKVELTLYLQDLHQEA